MGIIDRQYDVIAQEQLAQLRRDPNVYVECLIKFNSVRNLMHFLYVEAVTSKRIQPLESISEEHRRYYWNLAKTDAAGRLTRENLIRLSKVFYYLDFLISNQ